MRTEYERGLATAMLDAWYILTHLPDNQPNRNNCILLAANRLKTALQATGYMSEYEIFSQPPEDAI